MKFIALAAIAFSIFKAAAFAGETSSQVLSEMNLARTNPQAYARILAQSAPAGDRDVADAVRFLERATPLTPLASSNGLAQGANLHVVAQGSSGSTGHGSSPFSRMEKYGQWVGSAGENISYGKRDARSIVCQLIVDRGVSGKGHRKNIFSSSFGVAGVAYGSHVRFGSMCVIDFAGRYVERSGTVASL